MVIQTWTFRETERKKVHLLFYEEHFKQLIYQQDFKKLLHLFFVHFIQIDFCNSVFTGLPKKSAVAEQDF